MNDAVVEYYLVWLTMLRKHYAEWSKQDVDLYRQALELQLQAADSGADDDLRRMHKVCERLATQTQIDARELQAWQTLATVFQTWEQRAHLVDSMRAKYLRIGGG
jgi:hypothetical protein